jgi:hypothetical protein
MNIFVREKRFIAVFIPGEETEGIDVQTSD